MPSNSVKEISKRTDLIEGKEAFERFDALVGKVLSVSHEEILKRHAKHKATTHLRGKKRGPKPKQRDVSPDIGAAPP